MIVAEIGSNWHTQMDIINSIKAAKEAGADAVKLQLWREIYSRERAPELWEVTQDYRVPPAWLPDFQAECRRQRIQFHLTVFNEGLYDELPIVPDAVKVASGDLNYFPLLEAASKYSRKENIPLVLSTGTHTQHEVDEAVGFVMVAQVENIVLLNCVSLYPAPREVYDLQWMMRRYYTGIMLGISDHTMDSNLSVMALETGKYVWFEKHFRLAHLTNTPDAPHALTPEQFKHYVGSLKIVESRFEADKVIHLKEKPERLWMQRGLDGLRPRSGSWQDAD